MLKTLATITIIVMIVLVANKSFNNEKSLKIDLQQLDDEGFVNWQRDYSDTANTELGKDKYLEFTTNTEYYDYHNEIIAEISDDVRRHSTNSEEAIILSARKIYEKIKYVYGESDDKCYDGTAPNIIISGLGQCDTQSISLISVLRSMGIASVPAGGCVIKKSSCGGLQSIGMTAPRTSELTIITNEQETFSRSGGLHAWVMAWDENKGWIAIEATTGTIANTDCYDYHVELYPDNDDKKHICISDSYSYASSCQKDNYAGLDNNGLGLVNKIKP